jgi:Ca2+-binding RTX toxin-like protein
MVDYVGNKKANTFHGTDEHDTAAGAEGNDHLYGEGGDDSMQGDDGNDYLNGGSGNDTLYGGPGSDTFVGGQGNDLIVAESGTASLDGGSGDDKIFTWSSLGFSINSIVNGGGGNDVIDDESQSRGTTVDGGAGLDRYTLYRHETLTQGATIDFTPGQSSVITLPDATNFKNIEYLDFNGGTGNDTVTFRSPRYDSTSSGNMFNGNGGNDTLRVFWKDATTTISTGLSGDRYFVSQMVDGSYVSVIYCDGFSTENFTMESGSADDFLDGGDGTDILRGNGGADRLNGFLGHNTMEGGAGNDTINNSGKHSMLSGGSGNDYITEDPRARASTIDGGSGIDKLAIDKSELSAKLDITIQPGSDDVHQLADGTTFMHVEILDVRSGAGNDKLTLIHPATDEALGGGSHWSAGDGVDTLTVDISDLEANVDLSILGGFSLTRQDNFVTLVYGDNVEVFNITGSQGVNNLNGGARNDRLDGQGGNDGIDGGLGNDKLFGGAGDDIIGDGGGNDTINGGSGNDFLRGNSGIDKLTGGAGKDKFAYSAVSDSNADGFDTITDFDAADDRFSLSFVIDGVDAARTAATFAKIGKALDASHLDARHAALVTVSATGEMFLAMDVNGTAGYQAADDILIRLDHAKHLGQLDADNFGF